MPTGITIAGNGAISPDGSMLAVSVGIVGLQFYRRPTAVMVIDLRKGTARILPGTEEHVQLNYGSVGVLSAMVLPKTKLPGLDLGISPEMRSELPTLIAS
jgi:hypothetical protein